MNLKCVSQHPTPCYTKASSSSLVGAKLLNVSSYNRYVSCYVTLVTVVDQNREASRLVRSVAFIHKSKGDSMVPMTALVHYYNKQD